MEPEKVLLYAAALPAALAAAVLFERKLTKRGDDAGFALAAGFAAGYLALGGRWRFPPAEATHALLLVVLAAALALAFGYAKWIVPAVVRHAIQALLAGVAVWFTVLEPTVPWVGGCLAGMLAFMWTMDVRAERAGPRSFLATTLITAVATAVALERSGTATAALYSGALAAATGGALAFGMKWPVSTRGAALVAGLLLPLLWLNGWIFADLPLASMLLLAASPFASDAARRFASKRSMKPLAAFATEAGATIVLAGAAVGIAAANAPSSPY